MKKPLIGVCAGILTAALSMGVFAASGTTAAKVAANTSTTASTTDSQKVPPQKVELTDEQKAAMEAARKAQEAAWAALTDDQKQELYDLYSAKADAEKALIDKYLELGLMDSDKATKMKEAIADRLEKQSSDDKMPMDLMGGFGEHGGRGDKPSDSSKPDSSPSDSSTSTTDSSN